jgi:molecular chaperone HscB
MSAPCWQCEQSAGGSLFCKFCNSLQPPAADYFRFFGLERKLDLDLAVLQKRFYDLSRLVHPDRYTRRSPNEQRYSLEATAILNDAYRTLRDPVSRAEYVLKDEGFDIGEQKSNNVPPELLEEVFELNMALEDLRGGDESARPLLESELARFRSMRDSIDGELRRSFAAFDQTGDRAALEQIRALLNRRRYIHNLAAQIERELQER